MAISDRSLVPYASRNIEVPMTDARFKETLPDNVDIIASTMSLLMKHYGEQ